MEISYLRRYITGQYQHKEYTIKVSGTEDQIREQLSQKMSAVSELVSSLESVVTLANQAAQAGKKVSEIVAETSSEPKITQTDPQKIDKKQEAKKTTAKAEEEDLF